MSWSTEFPNSLNDIPRSFLKQFDDQSWHNDTMPNFIVCGHNDLEELNIVLWMDYKNEDERENESGSRFMLQVSGDDEELFYTDSFKALCEWMTDHLDYHRCEALINIIKYELNHINDEEYDGSSIQVDIQNMVYMELIKSTKHTEEELEGKYCHNTSEEIYGFMLEMLQLAMVDFAYDDFRNAPADETYLTWYKAAAAYFGEGFDGKTTGFMHIIKNHSGADLCDYLNHHGEQNDN